MIIAIQEKELCSRRQLEEVGLKASQRIPIHKRKKKPMNNSDADYECEICRANLFISHVSIFTLIPIMNECLGLLYICQCRMIVVFFKYH